MSFCKVCLGCINDEGERLPPDDSWSFASLVYGHHPHISSFLRTVNSGCRLCLTLWEQYSASEQSTLAAISDEWCQEVDGSNGCAFMTCRLNGREPRQDDFGRSMTIWLQLSYHMLTDHPGGEPDERRGSRGHAGFILRPSEGILLL